MNFFTYVIFFLQLLHYPFYHTNLLIKIFVILVVLLQNYECEEKNLKTKHLDNNFSYLGFGVLGRSSFFILSLFERVFGVDGLLDVL
jgi:hypothetical protein